MPAAKGWSLIDRSAVGDGPVMIDGPVLIDGPAEVDGKPFAAPAPPLNSAAQANARPSRVTAGRHGRTPKVYAA